MSLTKTIFFMGVSISVFAVDTSGVAAPESKASTASTASTHTIATNTNESRGAKVTETSHSWGAGLNIGWLSRRDFGARTFRRFHPEIVGYRYGILPFEDWFWRAGARFGYSAHQPEMPQAVRIIETDTSLSVEGSLIREWYLVLTGTLGLGSNFRKLAAKTEAPIEVVDSRLNRSKRLNVTYLQFGAGLPINEGLFLIEPLVRYQVTQFDDRSKWLTGIEFTVGW